MLRYQTVRATLLTNAPQPAGSPVVALVEYATGDFGVQRNGVALWQPTHDLARCLSAYRGLVHTADFRPRASVGV